MLASYSSWSHIFHRLSLRSPTYSSPALALLLCHRYCMLVSDAHYYCCVQIAHSLPNGLTILRLVVMSLPSISHHTQHLKQHNITHGTVNRLVPSPELLFASRMHWHLCLGSIDTFIPSPQLSLPRTWNRTSLPLALSRSPTILITRNSSKNHKSQLLKQKLRLATSTPNGHPRHFPCHGRAL